MKPAKQNVFLLVACAFFLPNVALQAEPPAPIQTISRQDQEAIENALRTLTPSQRVLLQRTQSEGTETTSVPIQKPSKEVSKSELPDTLVLTARQKRTCAYFYGKYEYEGIVTANSASGPQFPADTIELTIERAADGASYVHSCKSTAWCPKTDEIGGYLNACGKSRMRACASHSAYGKWCTNWTEIN